MEKCFVKNSKFDMRPLLGGTDMVFSHLIHGFSWYLTPPCNVAFEVFLQQFWFLSVHQNKFLFLSVEWCCRNPATFLRAYTCLPLPYAIRQAAGAALQDMPNTGPLFSLLMCGSKVGLLFSFQYLLASHCLFDVVLGIFLDVPQVFVGSHCLSLLQKWFGL